MMKRNERLAGVLICIVLAAVVFAPVPGRAQWVKVLHDFAHAPLFGAVAVLLLLIVRTHGKSGRLSPSLQYLLAFLLACILGALTELAQIPLNRDASWLDLHSDVLGAAGFLALFAAFDGGLSATVRTLTAIAGVALLVFHSTPLAVAASAYAHRASEFPVLMEFSDRRDGYFVAPQWAQVSIRAVPQTWAARSGEPALYAAFSEGPWPGVDFFEPAPDWRGYRALALDIVNPTDVELVLGFRAHDAHHNNDFDDRFNRTLHVPARTRTVLRIPVADIESAPRTRPMDLARMADFLLFRSSGSAAEEMYVVAVRLEK